MQFVRQDSPCVISPEVPSSVFLRRSRGFDTLLPHNTFLGSYGGHRSFWGRSLSNNSEKGEEKAGPPPPPDAEEPSTPGDSTKEASKDLFLTAQIIQSCECLHLCPLFAALGGRPQYSGYQHRELAPQSLCRAPVGAKTSQMQGQKAAPTKARPLRRSRKSSRRQWRR